MKGMAAQDSPNAAERPGKGAVFPHGADKVLAARRVKPAAGPQEWTDRVLIDPHHSHQQVRREIQNPAAGLAECVHRTRFTIADGWRCAARDAASTRQATSGNRQG